MLFFLTQNLSTLLVGGGLLAVILLIAGKLISDKKHHRSSCGGCCGGCPSAGICHRPQEMDSASPAKATVVSEVR